MDPGGSLISILVASSAITTATARFRTISTTIVHAGGLAREPALA